MKTTLALLAALLLALAVSGCARAQGARAARALEQLDQRFDRDGRLTRDEARQGMPWVERNFDAIDTARTGAVTLAHLKAYARAQRRAGAATPAAP
jgi:hypothetical protein